MARPTKRTPDVRAPILAAIRSGAVPEVAARAAGISSATFYRWRDDDVEFHTEVDEAVATAKVRMSETTFTAGLTDSRWA